MRYISKWSLASVAIGCTLLLSDEAQAQGRYEFKKVDPTTVWVELVAIFEGDNRLALLEVLRRPDSSFPARQNQEIMAHFYFGLEGQPSYNLVPLETGDRLRAEIAYEHKHGHYQYTVYRYWKQPKAAKSRSNPKGGSPPR